MKQKKTNYADDDTLSVTKLVLMRFPPLALGLLLGIFLAFAVSSFEKVLAVRIELAFFLPFVIYMADAVGTQTQSIYVRDLKSGRASFKRYLAKELFIGLVFGLGAGLAVGVVVFWWFSSLPLVLAVSLAMFFAVASAPLVALVVAEIFKLEHADPAVGAGPIATVVQDTLSVLIFGIITSLIVL